MLEKLNRNLHYGSKKTLYFVKVFCEGNNYAFIKAQNLHKGILDGKRFRIYLKRKYKISNKYVFLPYNFDAEDLYNQLKEMRIARYNAIAKANPRVLL